MQLSLYLLLGIASGLAVDNEDRRSKLPYVADAVGNTLPPPSKLPATVGSPVNLLTPDRYEFYTFDESGELVKRLMTLEEIQAIVAAGEETEGLVTFANDNQPTIAFNFSQPPYTKVHSVVTNVQNVLKAQMEAHKNNPQSHPTLDTPDVSDSWSLILPSIFGNTGVDIVPDKTSGTFTTPETETIELDRPSADEPYDNSLSKEGNNQILSSTTTEREDFKEVPVTEMIPSLIEDTKVNQSILSTTTTIKKPTITTTREPTVVTTTTIRPSTRATIATRSTTTSTTTTTTEPSTTTTTTQSTTAKTTTTTLRPTSTTVTTAKPRTTTAKPTTTTTSVRPLTTTSKPTTTKTIRTTTTTRATTKFSTPRITTTTSVPISTTTTRKPQSTTTTTALPITVQPELITIKPIVTTKAVISTTPKITTIRPNFITKEPMLINITNNAKNQTNIETSFSDFSDKNNIHFEKISTYTPVSTVTYITERTTKRPLGTTKPIVLLAATTKRTIVTTPTTKGQPAITTYKPKITIPISISTLKDQELEKINSTTITTQSVSPSTTVSSTEYMFVDNMVEKNPVNNKNDNDVSKKEPTIPLFDVAQSISQIASDLGNNYQPIPTVSNILDTTIVNNVNMASKENLEIDISAENKNVTKVPNVVSQTINENSDNFVKISTVDPHEHSNLSVTINISQKIENDTVVTTERVEQSTLSTRTTIDPILSESMDDLLSQVVNQAPESIIDSEKSTIVDNKIASTSTDKVILTTSFENIDDKVTSADFYIKSDKEIPITEQTSIKPLDIEYTDQELSLNNETKQLSLNNQSDVENVKTDVIENKDNNKGNNNSYVQILVSTNKSDIQSENITSLLTSGVGFKESENSESSKIDTQSTKIQEPILKEVSKPLNNSAIQNKEIQPTTVTVSITQKREDFLGISTESTPFQINVNKMESSNINKVTQEKDTPEFLPKVDEFKKKIQKVNIDDKELANERNNSWKLISTVSPPKGNEIPKDKFKAESISDSSYNKDVILDFSKENQGLEVSTKYLSEDVAQFTELCNELAFRYWNAMVENIDKKRSFVLSPYSITSMLAMMFMGARGATSGEMNEILKLDDMVTFNPHFTLKNISDSIEISPEAGVIVSAFIRELYSDRNKGKILTFYKERAQHFYNGHVEEINFKLISDIIRRRTNLLVKRYTWGRIIEYMKANTISMQPPLAAFSANIFQTDCTGSSVEGRDGEMYFVVSPNVRQRRLVPVPAVVYRKDFLAGYDPVLDATAAALGNINSLVSTLFLMPGQQGNVVHAEDLEALEKRLLNSNPITPTWNRLLRTLLPRIGLELQIPRFSHKSLFNVSSTLRRMGLKDLFDAEQADLGGLNGPSKDLYLSDMIQLTTFVTCGEGVIAEQHHIEEYPDTLEVIRRRRTSRWTSWDEPRDYQRAFHDPHDVGDAMHLPLHLRPRQARLPARNAQPARLKFDRPFLYFVRHNPSGMILYVGRYNPRLLP